MSTTEIKTGTLVYETRGGYGRQCVVLAARPKTLLVALRQKTTRRRSGEATYQVRTLSREAVCVSPLQSVSGASDLAAAAGRYMQLWTRRGTASYTCEFTVSRQVKALWRVRVADSTPAEVPAWWTAKVYA